MAGRSADDIGTMVTPGVESRKPLLAWLVFLVLTGALLAPGGEVLRLSSRHPLPERLAEDLEGRGILLETGVDEDRADLIITTADELALAPLRPVEVLTSWRVDTQVWVLVVPAAEQERLASKIRDFREVWELHRRGG